MDSSYSTLIWNHISNGTMFGDLDWPINVLCGLSVIAAFVVVRPILTKSSAIIAYNLLTIKPAKHVLWLSLFGTTFSQKTLGNMHPYCSVCVTLTSVDFIILASISLFIRSTSSVNCCVRIFSFTRSCVKQINACIVMLVSSVFSNEGIYVLGSLLNFLPGGMPFLVPNQMCMLRSYPLTKVLNR